MQKPINYIKTNKLEIETICSEKQNWEVAQTAFEQLFSKMVNLKDEVWSDCFINQLAKVYFEARDSKGCGSNITERTVNAMPENLQNNTKIVFLEIANFCRFFNASHKVNFEMAEIPENYVAVKLTAGKKKGQFTFAEQMPSLYQKISLTFDYWIPKFLEWTNEIRTKKLVNWQNEAILEHETCTDFMRICLLFLSNPTQNVSIAKTEDREMLLSAFCEEFVWIKKGQKREDILVNSMKLKTHFEKISKELNIEIPLDSLNKLVKIIRTHINQE